MNRMKIMLKEIADSYELFVLQVSDESIIPGTVMNCEWHRVIERRKWPEFTRVEGLAWELDSSLAGSENGHVRVKASMFALDFHRKMKVGVDVSMKDIGLTARADLESDKTISVTPGEVEVAHFTKRARTIEIAQALRNRTELRRWIDKDFLVSEAYFISRLDVEIKREGSVAPQASWETAGVKPVSASAKIEWTSESKFSLRDAFSVPFAVRGYRL